VAPQGAGAAGARLATEATPPGRSGWEETLKILREFCCRRREEEEERRKRYEEWRRRNLGSCYAEKLDYSIGVVQAVEIGREMLQALRPGDRVLIAFDPDEDPCFATPQTNGVLYADGYIPLYSSHCRCRRSDFDYFAIIQLPLYVRGPLPTRRYVPPSSSDPIDLLRRYSYYLKYETLVVLAKRDDNTFDVVDDYEYDYFLVALFYMDYNYAVDIESVEGAVWYGVYSWWNDYIYRGDERIAELGPCCDMATRIVLALIRKGTEAKVYYRDGNKRYKDVISTTQFPPSFANLRVE
jgi:hypothetical protein